jgi:hypothetical protein
MINNDGDGLIGIVVLYCSIFRPEFLTIYWW